MSFQTEVVSAITLTLRLYKVKMVICSCLSTWFKNHQQTSGMPMSAEKIVFQFGAANWMIAVYCVIKEGYRI